jgi:hypothetical protein
MANLHHLRRELQAARTREQWEDLLLERLTQTRRDYTATCKQYKNLMAIAQDTRLGQRSDGLVSVNQAIELHKTNTLVTRVRLSSL